MSRREIMLPNPRQTEAAVSAAMHVCTGLLFRINIGTLVMVICFALTLLLTL